MYGLTFNPRTAVFACNDPSPDAATNKGVQGYPSAMVLAPRVVLSGYGTHAEAEEWHAVLPKLRDCRRMEGSKTGKLS